MNWNNNRERKEKIETIKQLLTGRLSIQALKKPETFDWWQDEKTGDWTLEGGFNKMEKGTVLTNEQFEAWKETRSENDIVFMVVAVDCEKIKAEIRNEAAKNRNDN